MSEATEGTIALDSVLEKFQESLDETASREERQIQFLAEQNELARKRTESTHDFYSTPRQRLSSRKIKRPWPERGRR